MKLHALSCQTKHVIYLLNKLHTSLKLYKVAHYFNYLLGFFRVNEQALQIISHDYRHRKYVGVAKIM